MARDPSILELPWWLQTPPGRYLLEWERSRIDAHVADVFGFHALQLGLRELDVLQANRMPHRWLALQAHSAQDAAPAGEPGAAPGEIVPPRVAQAALCCDFDALPFAAQSLDLVVLPHTLEFARDPHQTLREVERVLVPEGRVVIVGFNPASLWGLRQWAGRWAARASGEGDGSGLFLPRAGDFIGHRRLRDWLRLLSFEVERGGFGCYRPALRTQRWLERYDWMEKAGDRWWPVFGAVYVLSAVKRVRGMRVIGPARKPVRKPRTAPAVVSHTHHNKEKPSR
ncbi:MAG: class I SAM-dependent methyltransferase [Methylibium sp.]|uniref:class I SAM-dependent methyltransferase n=1 Tax=Methylibium sp. TaxID=2067992 RepID=UPI0018320939|nr:class I SAM-dependent methyltransferase [Methylibium sp.]MBA3596200.1 class I SAM-dependent methyltransferase [Methylibium sp.]